MEDRVAKTREVLRTMQKEDQGKSVEASLHFFHHCEGKPVIEMSEMHSEPNARTGEFRAIPVTLKDSRRLADRPVLDR